MPEQGSVVAALGSVSLFSGLSPDEIKLLAAHAIRKRVSQGELLFSEGEACRGLHIIAAGRLRIFKSSPSGREQVLAVEGPGGSVAELPVFDGGPYPASVSAVEDSQILFISRDDFRRFCLDHPEVALKMLAVVGARLRRLVGIIEELSFATVRQRLVAVLVRLAESDGKRTPNGLELQLPGTHQDLAHQLGTVANYKWPIYFFVAVAFWNMVGAGLFGFLINPPIALYYVQGLNLTPVHGHTALFGVYGMLGLGLTLFCLRAIRPGRQWKDRPLQLSFWLINIGLVFMVVLSMLPIGILQAMASIQQGTWYARSAEFLQTPAMQTLRWMRVPGDVFFAAGAAILGLFVIGLLTGHSYTKPQGRTIEAEQREEVLVAGD